MKKHSHVQTYIHTAARAPCSTRAVSGMHIACAMARRLRGVILVPGLSARA